MRFSRAKPTGSFRIFHPSTRRVAAHAETLGEARKDAEYWTRAASGPIEIQERFPSGQWVKVQTVTRKMPSVTKKSGAPSKRSHATKAKAGDKKTTKIDMSQIAKMFGLPEWDSVDERNQHYYWEAARGAEDEEAAEQEARDELFGKWHGAVTGVAERLFGEHGLEIAPVRKSEKLPYEYKIVPQRDWKDAADKIRETINGVGYFHFNSLKEFLDSGPYTAQQAVLSHLGAVTDYPSVYGSTSASRMYENAMR